MGGVRHRAGAIERRRRLASSAVFVAAAEGAALRTATAGMVTGARWRRSSDP